MAIDEACSLADVPRAVLHQDIFRFCALEKEVAALRAEKTLLLDGLRNPYAAPAPFHCSWEVRASTGTCAMC